MYYIFFIHSSVNGDLGCFHVLASMKAVVSGSENYFPPMLEVQPELSTQGSLGAGGWVPCVQEMELKGALQHPLYR